jgi:SAM-dependent methyltransferase
MPDSYYKLRSNYNPNDARSNGYRSHGYFKKEQAILLKEMDILSGTLLDIACGSGLMLLPLLKENIDIVGVDYDLNACIAAKNNSLASIQGDVYLLPVKPGTIDYAISCQFLNQQEKNHVLPLLEEIYRVLKDGKRATLIWRNGDALIHRLATYLYGFISFLCNSQTFPYFNHPMFEVESHAKNIGFKICNKEVIFPTLSWRSKNTNGLASKIIGASFMLTIEKSQ